VGVARSTGEPLISTLMGPALLEVTSLSSLCAGGVRPWAAAQELPPTISGFGEQGVSPYFEGSGWGSAGTSFSRQTTVFFSLGLIMRNWCRCLKLFVSGSDAITGDVLCPSSPLIAVCALFVCRKAQVKSRVAGNGSVPEVKMSITYHFEGL